MSDSGLPEDESLNPMEVDQKVDTVDEQGTADEDPASSAPQPLETHRDQSTGMPATTAIYAQGS